MKSSRLLFNALFLALVILSVSQTKAQTQPETIEPLLRSIFEIQDIAGYRIISVSKNLPDSATQDFPFIAENRRPIAYLLDHVFEPFERDLKLIEYPSPTQAKEAAINSMLSDSTFLHYFKQLKAPYDTGSTPEASVPHISKETLMETGAKFFYAWKLDDKGIVWKICVEGNAFRELPPEERLETIFVQAFCFQSIFDNSEPGTNPEFWKSFEGYKKVVSELEDTAPEETLTRANQLMWAAMAEDEAFTKLLLENYREKKETLNFRLIE